MFRDVKYIILLAGLMITFSILACSSDTGEGTPEQETELRAAYERYREVVIAAFETRDPQYLEDVVTGEKLVKMIEQIESPGAQSSGLHENAQIEEVTVIYYGFTIAGIEVKEKWSRKAGDTESWHEDIIYCELIREAYGYDWKVSFFNEKAPIDIDIPEYHLTAPTPTP